MATLLREVIGDVLRRARIDQGRTLREVSDSARVSLGYLSEVERGRKEASSELLSAICGALDVPLSRVLTDAGDEMASEERKAVGARRRRRGQHRRHHQGRHPAGRVDGGGLSRRSALNPQGCGDLRETDKLAAKRTTGSRSHDTKAERTHGQSVRQGVEVPDGAVQLEGRRVRRPEGADPAGHRGSPASAPGADPAGRAGHRQPAPAGDAAQPSAGRHREAAGQRAPGADAGRPGHRRGRRRQGHRVQQRRRGVRRAAGDRRAERRGPQGAARPGAAGRRRRPRRPSSRTR